VAHRWWTLLSLIFWISCASSPRVWAGPGSDQIERWIKWETEGNTHRQQSSAAFDLEYFEIPRRLLESEQSEQLEPQVRRALIFRKNREEYVRWLIHPEDTLYQTQVAEFLRSRGLSDQRHRRFRAYRTSSRSMIVYDPVLKTSFSAKVSTNTIGGKFEDKKQSWSGAKESIIAERYLETILSRFSPKYFTMLDEPAVFGIEAISQGMMIRSIRPLTKSGKTYLPGFSVLNDKIGREIAEINGESDPAKFWNEHYNRPLAAALAEFMAMTGMTYEYPHGQNVLVELDEKLKPTGRIIFRDFGDCYILKALFRRLGGAGKVLLENWSGRYKKDNLFVRQWHYRKEKITWLGEAQSSQWKKDYFSTYSDTFRQLTGVQIGKPIFVESHGDLGESRQYEVAGRQWASYLDSVAHVLESNVPKGAPADPRSFGRCVADEVSARITRYDATSD